MLNTPLSPLLSWLLAAQVHWVPATSVDLPRYEGIARDIVAVSFDPEEAPLFAGPRGRARTALFIDAVASFESFYREDVDQGKKRGDLGEVCILQVLLPSSKMRIVM